MGGRLPRSARQLDVVGGAGGLWRLQQPAQGRWTTDAAADCRHVHVLRQECRAQHHFAVRQWSGRQIAFSQDAECQWNSKGIVFVRLVICWGTCGTISFTNVLNTILTKFLLYFQFLVLKWKSWPNRFCILSKFFFLRISFHMGLFTLELHFNGLSDQLFRIFL